MTAINVLIGHGEAHVFANTGHYDARNGRLDHLADKVFPLPGQHALLAWSGPSSVGPKLADMLRRSSARSIMDLMQIAPAIVVSLHLLQRFSAVIVGAGIGIAVEEGGRVHHLQPGSVVRSISASTQLDPEDLKASGVRLMEAQRQSSGVVFGQCQYWHVGAGGATKQVLHDWHDRPAKIGAASTLASKFQDLTVDRINVTPNAVTKIVSGTTSITSGGDGSYPNVLWGVQDVVYNSSHTGALATLTLRILRASDNRFVYQKDTQRSGLGNPAIHFNIKYSFVDVGMAANENYQISWASNWSYEQASIDVYSTGFNLFYTVR